MKVLYAASEAMPFIKSGGLGDVAGALPKALQKLGVDVRVIIPFYSNIPQHFRQEAKLLLVASVPLGWRNQYCGIFQATHNDITYYLLDNEYYFKRDGNYGQFDDGERFAFFSRACLEALHYIDFIPDIIHFNDWHTGLIPVFLKLFYKDTTLYSNIKTIFTIHNIEYQGVYGLETLIDVFGIGESDAHLLEYNHNMNIMKGAIQTADRVTTVSKTYAQEIKDPYFANGLEHILLANAFKLTGIVNGIDTELFDPRTDKALFEPYDASNLKGKGINKKGLQELFNLPERENVPVIAMITRLTGHKGIDLVSTVIEEILSKDVQFIILGKGEFEYEALFCDLEKKYPTKLKAAMTFSIDLASKIYAGADLFLMPSKSEPCGLAQMIALRYGTVPIVRETGGLKDTIIPFNPHTKVGNGFTFVAYNAYDMLDAINRALDLYADEENYNMLVQNAFASDSSWQSSAEEYLEVYKECQEL
jgi:starch synthase